MIQSLFTSSRKSISALFIYKLTTVNSKQKGECEKGMVFAINAKTDAFKAFVAKAKLFKESDLKNGTSGWNLTNSTTNTTVTSQNVTTVVKGTKKGKRDDGPLPVRLYGRGGGGSVLRRRWW